MRREVLLIDNHDSFTYNLAQYLMAAGASVTLWTNDAFCVSSISELGPTHIVISPGPGHPTETPQLSEVIRAYFRRLPILGVCLGHQAIACAFGGRVVPTDPVHGKSSAVWHDGHGVFAGLPSPIQCVRYHSLAVDAAVLPSCLSVTARTHRGEIMGIRHEDGFLEGVQFHPESILSEGGMDMIRNFLGI